jgi:hypothetical protein
MGGGSTRTLETFGQVMPLELSGQRVRSSPSRFPFPNSSLLLTAEPFAVIYPIWQYNIQGDSQDDRTQSLDQENPERQLDIAETGTMD